MPTGERGFDRSLAEATELHRSGRLDQAEQIYLRLLPTAPHHDGLYDLLGLIAHQRNHRGLSRRWLRQALALAPGRAKTWRDLALPEQDVAGRFVLRAIAIEPGAADHWLALDLVERGDAALRRGLALLPDAEAAWARHARRRLEAGAVEAALASALRVEAIAGRAGALQARILASPPSAGDHPIEPARIVLDDGELTIAPYCGVMNGATVTGDFLVLPSPNSILVDGLVPDPADPLQHLRGVVAIGPRHAIVRKGTSRHAGRAMLLGGSRNYYHWLIDHLPRLALFDPEPGRHLVVNSDLATFQLDSLLHLGFDDERLLKLDVNERLEVEDLVVPSLLTKSSLVHPAALAWLRRRFLTGDDASAPRRLYVSRQAASQRRLLDEPAVIDLLRSRGFTIVRTEGMGVTSQAALFAGADLIVTVHGAALANLAFASAGASVVEIDAEGSRRSFFSIIAAMNGLQHRRVFGRAVTPHALQYSDIVLGERGLTELASLL